MPIPTPPPQAQCNSEHAPRAEAPIHDVREQFARRTPQTAEERARARAFIDGKIEMVRSDPQLTDAQKAAAIAELEAKR